MLEAQQAIDPFIKLYTEDFRAYNPWLCEAPEWFERDYLPLLKSQLKTALGREQFCADFLQRLLAKMASVPSHYVQHTILGLMGRTTLETILNTRRDLELAEAFLKIVPSEAERTAPVYRVLQATLLELRNWNRVAQWEFFSGWWYGVFRSIAADPALQRPKTIEEFKDVGCRALLQASRSILTLDGVYGMSGYPRDFLSSIFIPFLEALTPEDLRKEPFFGSLGNPRRIPRLFRTKPLDSGGSGERA